MRNFTGRHVESQTVESDITINAGYSTCQPHMVGADIFPEVLLLANQIASTDNRMIQ